MCKLSLTYFLHLTGSSGILVSFEVDSQFCLRFCNSRLWEKKLDSICYHNQNIYILNIRFKLLLGDLSYIYLLWGSNIYQVNVLVSEEMLSNRIFPKKIRHLQLAICGTRVELFSCLIALFICNQLYNLGWYTKFSLLCPNVYSDSVR